MSDRIEPEWALATIAFVDIRGFTGYADRATALEAVGYLNEFFGLVVPIVEKHGGRVNKLLGDGLLGVFGAPGPSAGHADRALAASIEILAVVEAGMGDRCRIGIGINSGLVLTGTVGGGGFTELGVVGDPVNVAARVQDATRDLGEPLLLTEATRALLDDLPVGLRTRGSLSLRGKRDAVAVHATPRFELRNGSRTRRR